MSTVSISSGVWPTMITPFTETNEIDYIGLERMIDWYINKNVNGLFAVCQSSEMFFMSMKERVALASFVKEKAGKKVQVIASGHISETIGEQINELSAIAETGVEALVLVSNRLAGPNEPDEKWKRNAERILEEIPDMPFGIYECPYPYKRLISPELLKWCASTGRFLFLKDTCCNTEQIGDKLQAVKGTNLKIFNANTATLLDSLKLGASGYSGVMGNFHPDLYVWLYENWKTEPEKAQELQNFLGLSSVIECQYYPVNAKYYLQLEGLDISTYTRAKQQTGLTYSNKLELNNLFDMTKQYYRKYNL